MTNLDYYSLSSIYCILVFDAISVLCVCVLGLIQLSAISVIGKGINLNA